MVTFTDEVFIDLYKRLVEVTIANSNSDDLLKYLKSLKKNIFSFEEFPKGSKFSSIKQAMSNSLLAYNTALDINKEKIDLKIQEFISLTINKIEMTNQKINNIRKTANDELSLFRKESITITLVDNTTMVEFASLASVLDILHHLSLVTRDNIELTHHFFENEQAKSIIKFLGGMTFEFLVLAPIKDKLKNCIKINILGKPVKPSKLDLQRKINDLEIDIITQRENNKIDDQTYTESLKQLERLRKILNRTYGKNIILDVK